MARKSRIDTLDELLKVRSSHEVGEERWTSYAYGYVLGILDGIERGTHPDTLIKDSIKHLKEFALAKEVE